MFHRMTILKGRVETHEGPRGCPDGDHDTVATRFPGISAFLLAIVVLSGLTVPSSAWAQDDKKPSPEMIAKAQKHTQKGTQYYAEGEYSRAVVEFMNAHSLSPNAMFLYNISLAYGKLGNYGEALTAAEKARNFGGMPEQFMPRNEGRIAAFRLRLKSSDLASSISTFREQESETPPPAVQVRQEETTDSGFGALGWTGIGLTTAGAGMLIASLLVDAAVSEDIDALEQAAEEGDEAEFQRLNQEVSDGQSLGRALVFTGGGFAALGLTFIIIEFLPSSTESKSAFQVHPVSGGAVVGFTRSF